MALPGFTGDFDHFAVDEIGGRLFLAGEDHKTVEVFDLRRLTALRASLVSARRTPSFIFPNPIEFLSLTATKVFSESFAGRIIPKKPTLQDWRAQTRRVSMQPRKLST